MTRVVLLSLLLACSGSTEDPEPERARPEVEAPATPPEGTLLTIDVAAGALQSLGETLESPLLRALVPGSPSELVARIEERPRNVDERTPVRIVAVGEWSQPRIAVGFGSNGRRAVVASDPELVDEARAWASASVEVDGIEARFEDAAMDGLRQTLERALDDQVRSAQAGIAIERARHDEPPAYGDPNAIVGWVAQRLASYLALVSDLRGARAVIELDPFVVRGAFRAEPDSVAARALQQERVAEVPAIPGGSALAWWRAAPRAGWAQLLEVSAGERLSSADREQVSALGELSSDGSLLAVGHDTAPFAWVTSPAEADLARLFRIDHVRTLLGLFRCDRVRRVSTGARLCADGPFVTFTSDDGIRLAISDREDFAPTPAARRVVPERASGFVLIDAARLASASRLMRPFHPTAPPGETPLAMSWTASDASVELVVRFAPGSLAAVADASMAASDP